MIFLNCWGVRLSNASQKKIPDDGVVPLEQQRRSASQRIVLGSTVLDEVYKDMDRTILPDWVQPAPSTMGQKSHGRLSANEWRSAVTIHLPITLIRLWSRHPKTSRYFAMLIQLLNLALVVGLATRRSTSASQRANIAYCMLQYLDSTRLLFPLASIVPNHHLGLHLPRFLKLFGPPHAWWCFPYERLNGMLQDVHTNHRFGEPYAPVLRVGVLTVRSQG